MADEGKKKQPLSLNQLHNRYLSDLSASHSKPNPKPVDVNTVSKVKLDEAFESIEENDDDVPRFNFDSPSPVRVDDDNSRSEVKNVDEAFVEDDDFVPRFNFDTPSPVHEKEADNQSISSNGTCAKTGNSGSHPSLVAPKESQPHESGKAAKEFDFESQTNSSISNSYECNTNLPGEEGPTKVRIEGRRRLCKISQKDFTKDDEPRFDGISDFDSPLQTNKPLENNGSEIRDILNELSSRFDILSIDKKRVPKKVEVDDLQELSSRFDVLSIEKKRIPKEIEVEDLQAESGASKLFNVNITEEEIPEYQTANRSSLFESKVGGISDTNEHHQQKKPFKSEVHKNNNFAGKLKNDEHMRARVKSKESQPYNSRQEKDEKHSIKQVDKKKGKYIDISDDEPDDEVTVLDDHVYDEFKLTGPRSTYRLPSKIATMLYPHQREGLKWLWSLHFKGKGGILGDDMGLGKTMQMCSFIAGLFHSNLVKRVLIVAPKTLLTHWIKELSTVGLSGKTREYFSTCAKLRHYELQYILQDKGVLLTTYDIVRNNTKSLCGDNRYNDDGEEEETTWDYMILDEGHLIKNPNTQRAKSLLQIPCRHRIIISGTPLQNNLKELWALFSFCCPELLGDKNEFKVKYENYINRGMEKNASDREMRIGSSVAKDLRDCIEPYFLRRMKSEVFRDDASLSKKNEIIVWLRLTQCQRQLYEAFLKSEIVVSAFDGSPLAAITILKKICDHPLLLTKRAAEDVLEGMEETVNQEDHHIAEKLAMHIADVAERSDILENHDISCKISFIMSLLGDLLPKGHNVLIFSQTRKMLDLIQESLTLKRYKYMRIDGTTKIDERARVVKDFQEGRGAPIFLLTSQVGGLGLTLTNADRVIVVDPAWNPSTDNQSVDRAYRIGQKKDVIVYRLMTSSTVEEKIYRKQVFKGGLFRSATDNKEYIRYFSQQDLRDLFSLPKHGFDVSPTQQQLHEEHDHQHTMEESLRVHVEFLETLNIAGVSQHSLLFSKAAPAQTVEIEEEEEKRLKGSKFMGNAYRRPSVEHSVDGSQYAFNPKDVKKVQKNSSPDDKEPSEDEIRARINRLSQLFANKVAISKLPDKGEKIQRQIAALNLQLEVRVANNDVIEL